MCPCRDLVHRQTASAVVQHMSLGVYGFGCEDSLNHLLNYVWPNVFETSPHVIQAVMGALEGLRVAIGPCRMLQYCLQVRTFTQCLTYSSGILNSFFHNNLFLSSNLKLFCLCPVLNTLCGKRVNPVYVLFFSSRVSSIQLARSEMCTGRFTTRSTSAPRMP